MFNMSQLNDRQWENEHGHSTFKCQKSKNAVLIITKIRTVCLLQIDGPEFSKLFDSNWPSEKVNIDCKPG